MMTSKSLECRPLSKVLQQVTPAVTLSTETSKQQCAVEKCVQDKYSINHIRMKINPELPKLNRDQHKQYLLNNLHYLSEKYEKLDASRPWICYWIVHPLALLEVRLDDSMKSRIAQFLGKCQCPSGGFGGGPGQFAHLAPTYAAVNALVTLGTEEAYNVIDRRKLFEFLMTVRQPDGSFAMHVDGEVDIRGTYCAIAVASITNMLSKELVDGTAEWIVSCQTYEGGFAGFPGMEAHGGYTFCGIAALVILSKGHLCDLSSLLRWLTFRQMKFEGGFQGRTNKLVDGCYSFWQGGAFPVVYSILAKGGLVVEGHLFNDVALQEYILFCCQYPSGGLLDKPGKGPDVYHTCYTLSGLAIAQHFRDQVAILGSSGNEIEVTHPLYNIRADHVQNALLYFMKLEIPSPDPSFCPFV